MLEFIYKGVTLDANVEELAQWLGIEQATAARFMTYPFLVGDLYDGGVVINTISEWDDFYDAVLDQLAKLKQLEYTAYVQQNNS